MVSLQVEQYIEVHAQEMYELLKELASIPAPSHEEDKRALFCLNLLKKWGAENAYMDAAKNVVFPYQDDGKEELVVFTAHMDVVFPDTDKLPVKEEGDLLFAPGVGDDTCNLVTMLFVVKYLLEHSVKSRCGIVFVCNSCEEGLGNLKGTSEICRRFSGRIRRFYAFDGQLSAITASAIGSKRYKVCVDTEGGHSYADFGKTNAIAVLAHLIEEIYALDVPPQGITTYNVGTISGGTTVNSIAQHAEMICEFRFDLLSSMHIMEDQFQRIFAGNENVQVTVECIGERPCGSLTEDMKEEQSEMIKRAKEILEHYGGKEALIKAGSTDCNIPLPMNVPAICYGFYIGNGAHTRQESIRISSLKAGYYAAFASVLDYFEE